MFPLLNTLLHLIRPDDDRQSVDDHFYFPCPQVGLGARRQGVLIFHRRCAGSGHSPAACAGWNRPLLNDVGQLVGEQALALAGVGVVFAGVEIDVFAVGESLVPQLPVHADVRDRYGRARR